MAQTRIRNHYAMTSTARRSRNAAQPPCREPDLQRNRHRRRRVTLTELDIYTGDGNGDDEAANLLTRHSALSLAMSQRLPSALPEPRLGFVHGTGVSEAEVTLDLLALEATKQIRPTKCCPTFPISCGVCWGLPTRSQMKSSAKSQKCWKKSSHECSK
jgi:hypothetical protein